LNKSFSRVSLRATSPLPHTPQNVHHSG